jgi:hypothetical protein
LAGLRDAPGDQRPRGHRLRHGFVEQGDVEAVTRAVRGIGTPLDEQRVAAVHSERPLTEVIVHGRAIDHRTTVGIEQAPVDVAGVRKAVNEEALASRDTEAVGVGLVAWIELCVDRRSRCQLLRLRDIDQAETVGADLVGDTIDAQGVVARPQIEGDVAAPLVGIRSVEATLADHRAARSFERPAHAGIVGQRIEHHANRFVQRESVAIGLAGDVDRAIDLGDRYARRAVEQDARFERLEVQAPGACRQLAGRWPECLGQKPAQPRQTTTTMTALWFPRCRPAGRRRQNLRARFAIHQQYDRSAISVSIVPLLQASWHEHGLGHRVPGHASALARDA